MEWLYSGCLNNNRNIQYDQKNSVIGLVKYFSSLKDPRAKRQKLHALPDILFIVFCGSICGVEAWEDFVDFAE